MKKIFKRTIAAITAGVMMLSITLSASAEVKLDNSKKEIAGYDIYLRDGQYYTLVDGVEYMVVTIGEGATVVTDHNLIRQLNYATSARAVNSNDYPSYSWPHKWLYNLSSEGPYMERVNLSSGDYYSPSFITNVPSGNTIGQITIDY